MEWLQKALREADLDYLSPHDLRHTAASLAIQSGASVKAVQRMLGHASAAMTLDVYADLFDSDLDDVAARMDEAWAGVGGDSSDSILTPSDRGIWSHMRFGITPRHRGYWHVIE